MNIFKRFKSSIQLLKKLKNVSAFKLSTSKINRKTLKYEEIPGPKYYKFLGPINDIINLGSPSKLHKTIDAMHKKYGPVFRIKIGGQPSLFISAYDCMRAIFTYEGKYPRHPLPPAWDYYNKKYNCKRGLFFMDGEEWLHYRKILNPLLLKNFSHYKTAIEKACENCLNLIDTIIAKVHENQKIPINSFIELKDLESLLYRWSINVILRIMVTNLILPTPMIDEFASIVYEIFEKSVPLQSIPPQIADILNIKEWTSFCESVDLALKLANAIIDYMIANCRDDENGLLHQLKKAGLAEAEIKRIFVDLIIAAGDTTSFATQWLLYLVAKNRNTQQLIQKNLNDELSFETPLVKGAVRETLRLYPPATFIGRFISEDSLIGKYHVPKDTLCLISLFTAGRAASHFANPLEFKPERWARDDDMKDNHKPQATMPYAIGSRSCIGQKIANYQMQVLLTKLLNKYDLNLINTKDVDSQMKMIIAPADKIRIGFKCRTRNV